MHSEWFLLERGGPSREWEAGHPEICGLAALGKIHKYKLLRNTRTLHLDSSMTTKNIMCVLKVWHWFCLKI